MKRTPLVVVAAVLAVAGLLSWGRSRPQPRAGTSTGPANVDQSTSAWRPMLDGAKDDVARLRVFELAAATPTAESLEWLARSAETDPLGARAAAALGTVKSPAMCEALVRLAREGGTLSRSNAIRAEGNSGGCNDASNLAALVGDVEEPLRIRQEAVAALAKIRGPSIVAALATAIDRLRGVAGPDAEQLRISIIQALGAIGSLEANRVLSGYARSPQSPLERAFIAKYTPASR